MTTNLQDIARLIHEADEQTTIARARYQGAKTRKATREASDDLDFWVGKRASLNALLRDKVAA